MSYAELFNTRATPQSQPVPGRDMVANSAGGFVFQLDDWKRLERFVILGSDAPTYYATARALTRENAECVLRCLKEDGPRAVGLIAGVSEAGRAPRNDAAVFALALCAAFGDKSAKEAAYAALPRVCRTGTHLFQFAEASQALRGWGGGLRRAVGRWYLGRDPRDLAYQCVKYQQRNGWSHRDLLRLSHPRATGLTNDVLHWVTRGWPGVGEGPHPEEALRPIWAFERAKRAKTETEVVRLIRDFRLVRECVPTQWLNSPAVWEALLEGMPLGALVRNLAKMTAVGLIKPLSLAARSVCDRLGNVEAIRRARLHPLSVLVALKTYAQGHGEKGRMTWSPDQHVLAALDSAFYGAFQAVEPTGKRWLLALDVSGSMTAPIANLNLSCREAAAALALVTVSVESQSHTVAFTSEGYSRGPGQWAHAGFGTAVSPIAIAPRMRLQDAMNEAGKRRMGGTDCALPMLYAADQGLGVDAFVVLTDNETWANPQIHPFQALRQYREKTGIGAKLIVVGMTSTGFSIADPQDGGMLDITGMDTAAPAVMADFVRN